MGPGKIAPGEFGEDLPHGHAYLRRSAHHGRLRQHASQAFRRRQHLIQHFGGDGKHPALGARFECIAVDMADRHVDDAHRPQRLEASLQRRLSAAAFDQQNLVQPRMPVRREFPFVQHRARRDGFAMHDVG